MGLQIRTEGYLTTGRLPSCGACPIDKYNNNPWYSSEKAAPRVFFANLKLKIQYVIVHIKYVQQIILAAVPKECQAFYSPQPMLKDYSGQVLMKSLYQ